MRSLAKKTLGSTLTGRAIFLWGAEARSGAVDILGGSKAMEEVRERDRDARELMSGLEKMR